MMTDTQQPNEITEELLDAIDGDRLTIFLEDGTELSVSVRRPLHLPHSVDESFEGGSLRYSVEATDETVDELDLPAREGLIAAEEIERGSWSRSRIEFREVVSETDEDVEKFGDAVLSNEIAAVET